MEMNPSHKKGKIENKSTWETNLSHKRERNAKPNQKAKKYQVQTPFSGSQRKLYKARPNHVLPTQKQKQNNFTNII